jgi:hypothetical protein
VSAVVAALLAELDDRALEELAAKLRPFLAAGDGWLGTRDAAAYAGCTVHALRHAMGRGDVEFEQACPGGKTWLRRAALDRWRDARRP